MQLSPRYGDQPILRIDSVGEPGAAMVRQRRRLGRILDSLDASQWATLSRCEGWSVRDVISHLVSTNQFWAFSIAAGQRGEPTTFLATFDPVASPAQLVERERAVPTEAVLEQYHATVEQLAAAVGDVDGGDGWGALAEAPPGHLATSAVVSHALWDAWIHERDVVVPLGMAQEIETDEVGACLRYVAALGPSFLAASGSTRTGTLGVDATAPDIRIVVEVGSTVVVHEGDAGADAPVLHGSAVDLVEGLSFRAPLDHGLATDDQWLLGGLDVVFDRT